MTTRPTASRPGRTFPLPPRLTDPLCDGQTLLSFAPVARPSHTKYNARAHSFYSHNTSATTHTHSSPHHTTTLQQWALHPQQRRPLRPGPRAKSSSASSRIAERGLHDAQTWSDTIASIPMRGELSLSDAAVVVNCDQTMVTMGQELIRVGFFKSRPFACEECGKGFIQASALKVHFRTQSVDLVYLSLLEPAKSAFSSC